ncbi:MAG: hypothetical protein VKL39_03745 [Leptolyngbyaceae bacterium]|nr:hypothetical protein [Leptolyngbyaceae bacterium]
MHFHWSQSDILTMDHGDRRHWVQVIQRAQQQLLQQSS